MSNTMEARKSGGSFRAGSSGARPLARALRVLLDEHALALEAASEAAEPRRRLTALRSLYLEQPRVPKGKAMPDKPSDRAAQSEDVTARACARAAT
jgi:hypothetical protein